MSANKAYIRYPILQVRPYGFLAYDRIEYPTSKRKKPKPVDPPIMHISPGSTKSLTTSDKTSKFEQNAGKGQYHGLVTTGAVKRMKRAISLIVAIAEPKKAMNWKLNKEFTFKLNFITLTLPSPQGKITDKEIKKEVLDVWIKAAKRRFKLKSYIWRAERQRNGNLHFHLITDTYIPYNQLRDSWNDRLNRLGLIDTFEKKHKHRHPNSTDVHSIQNVKNLSGYFIKYMTKGEVTRETCMPVAPWNKAKNPPTTRKKGPKFKYIPFLKETQIDGKIWDCSRNLKYKPNCETLLEGEARELWERAVSDPFVNTKKTDHCTLAFLSAAQFEKYVIASLKTQYDEWLSHIKNIPDEPPPKIIAEPPDCPF